MHEDYQAYLIRFQRSEGQPHWRVRLEDARSGEVRHFATEWEMLRYLTQILAIVPDAPDANRSASSA
jgi:hypothetical protein